MAFLSYSVVIPTTLSRLGLLACVDAVLGQTVSPQQVVVVVGPENANGPAPALPAGVRPVAEHVWFHEQFNLPIYPQMDDQQLDYMIDVVQRCVRGLTR